jgi:MFS family permease
MYPYASNMVMDFGLTEDRSATGYYAGFLCGGIMLGRAIGAPFWGYAADKYGRKPTLLISLSSIIGGSLVFGMAPSFAVAAVSLFIAGLFCTLAVVCKTCVSEVTPPALQAKGMSCYTLGWYYGQIAGYSVGGLLVHPEKTGIVTGGLFARFPYLLPNLICSVLGLIALIGVIFFFKETLPPPKPSSSSPSVSLPPASRPFSAFRSANICSMVCMYSIHVFCNTGFVETYPLWCWSSKDKGGLSFDPQEIGGTLTISYIAMICVQSVLYSRMVKWLGLIGVIKASSIAMIPVLLGFPFIGVLRETQWMLKAALVIGCLLYYLLGFNIFTSIFVLTNNSVLQGDRAKVNGCQMAIGYIVKGFTPLLIGNLFAFTSQNGGFFPFDYHFVFTLLAVGMGIEALLAQRLPKSLEMPKSVEYSPVLPANSKEIELNSESK